MIHHNQTSLGTAMQYDASLCTLNQFKVIQQAHDAVWEELRSFTVPGTNLGSYNGPRHPGMLREEIARRVLSHLGDRNFTSTSITRAVVRSFGLGPNETAAVLSFSGNKPEPPLSKS
jgi:hypothetical protein